LPSIFILIQGNCTTSVTSLTSWVKTMGEGAFRPTMTDDGYYEVIPPIDGLTPDSIAFRDGDTRYRFSGYRGTAATSRVHPDVLLYEHVERKVVDDTWA
jgi:hypothetical protein